MEKHLKVSLPFFDHMVWLIHNLQLSPQPFPASPSNISMKARKLACVNSVDGPWIIWQPKKIDAVHFIACLWKDGEGEGGGTHNSYPELSQLEKFVRIQMGIPQQGEECDASGCPLKHTLECTASRAVSSTLVGKSSPQTQCGL